MYCKFLSVACGAALFALSAPGLGAEAGGGRIGRDFSGPSAVNESAREVPVAASADVVVVGGTSGGVAAATAAARAGAKVFLIAPQTYLGEDMAGTMRLWLESGEKPGAGLPEAIFGQETFVTPGKLKQALEDALAAAGVDFLYGCYAADVLTDGEKKPCGVVMANRSGRQAVLAKVIIDATPNATVARLAGAEFTPFAAGLQNVRWITIAAEARADAGQKARKLPLPLEVSGRTLEKGGVASKRRTDKLDYAWWEYTLSLDLADGSWPARARLEQQVRDLAYHETQLYSADVPYLVPADAIVAEKAAAGARPDAAKADLGAFRPAGVERLWVLGGCAAVPRAQVEALLRPLAFLEIGERIGKAAAEQAQKLEPPQSARVARAGVAQTAPGEIKEALAGIGSWSKSVPQDQGALPVLGRYDVVVVGGGTTGAPAGIGAARQGAKTLVIEYLHGLGGVGTLGMIGGYFHGNKAGFTRQIPANPTEKRMEWYRRELRQAGADVWFGAIGCGAVVEGRRVTGVVVATPHGRGVVLAQTVIDATGNSDIAIAAGAEYLYLDDPRDPDVVQNAHLPPRPIGVSYANGNLLPIDDANPAAATRFFRTGRRRLSNKGVFDVGQLVDSRERRRIVGDYCLDWMDILNQRTFPDTIEYAKSSYDSHGGPTHVYFRFGPIPGTPGLGWMGPAFWAYVPYRCLLPRGLEGVLVVGLGMSADRNAMPIVRMQPDMHNQGYAAGVAAAMAAKAGVTPRQVDVKALQRHLVEVGNLAPEVLTHTDSYPLPQEKIKAAVETAGKDFQGIEVLLAQPEAALPLLRGAYEREKGEAKLAYACILAFVGDATGVPTLLEAVKAANGAADVQAKAVAALGYARDRRAVPVLLESLKAKNTRYAAAEALGRIGDPAAAAALAAALSKQQAEDQRIAAKRKDSTPDRRAVKTQLMIVWALWRCGDKDDAAKTALRSFADGENSLYAHFARKLLGSPPKRAAPAPNRH